MEAGRDSNPGPLLKRQMLYRLSYRPIDLPGGLLGEEHALAVEKLLDP